MRNFFLAVCLFACALVACAQSPTNLYLGGVSVNRSASPAIAATGLYSRALTGSTAAFTVVDVLPGVKGTVTTSIGAGIAQRVATIGKIPVFIPTSAGVSINGGNAGWTWATGGGALVQVKPNWYLMPTLRVRKDNVSGYQLIPGILFGWGK